MTLGKENSMAEVILAVKERYGLYKHQYELHNAELEEFTQLLAKKQEVLADLRKKMEDLALFLEPFEANDEF